MDEQDTTAADVIMLKEENKFIVKDFEQMEIDKAKEKELKRKRREAFGYGAGEDMPDSDSGDEKPRGSLKQRVKEAGQSMGQIMKMQG